MRMMFTSCDWPCVTLLSAVSVPQRAVTLKTIDITNGYRIPVSRPVFSWTPSPTTVA